MKKRRVGTISMGLALILLGLGIFVHQFNPGLGRILAANCLPFALLALGVEMLLSHYLARKAEADYSYDFASMFFVFLLGFIGLGFYSLETLGFLGKLSEAAFAGPQAVEYRREFAPSGRVKEVILESASNWRRPVRIWDAEGDRIVVKVRGFAREGDPEAEEVLAPVAAVEEIGGAVYLRLRSPYPDFPRWPRIDQVEVMIPSKYRLDARSCFNLNAEEFHGTVE